jgi:hypothetical protein
MTVWYSAAYETPEGRICALGQENVIREYAEAEAARYRSPEDTTEIFVAYRDIPDWRRAE